MKTTLNEIRKYEVIWPHWIHLLRHVNKTKADDDQLDMVTVLECVGLEDTLRLLDIMIPLLDTKRVKLALAFAKEVSDFLPAELANILEVVERYVKGDATRADVAAARVSFEDSLKNIQDAVKKYREPEDLTSTLGAASVAYAASYGMIRTASRNARKLTASIEGQTKILKRFLEENP